MSGASEMEGAATADDRAVLAAKVAERRAALGALGSQCQAEEWGLALSGGGVRSATFCYGLVSALAQTNTFFRFDLMSTVSGGGYIGAAIGRLAHSAGNVEALQTTLAGTQGDGRMLAWLRSNSRFLSPRGSHDLMLALVSFFRNLTAIHIELGVLGVLLGCVLGAVDLAAWSTFDHYIAVAEGAQKIFRINLWGRVSEWPTLWLVLPLPILATAVHAWRYWLLQLVGLSPTQVARRRDAVTASLAASLGWVLFFLALGAVDWSAWRIAQRPSVVLELAASFAVGLAGMRTLLPMVQSAAAGASAGLMARLPLAVDLLGRFGLVVLVLFWTTVVHAALTRRIFNEDLRQVDFGLASICIGAVALFAVLWIVFSGRRLEFLNSSSLHHFYRSRLTCTYLGAANAARQPDSDSTQLSEEDDIAFDRYAPYVHGGPVHLINVCVNQTSYHGGRFNLDRQGELMTLAGPGHYRVEKKRWATLAPSAMHTLGTWMAVSGAAAAPGLGSATRPGWAAILTMLGLRLGFWWDSGVAAKPGKPKESRLPKYAHLLDELLARLPGSETRVQYLSDGGHSENTGAYPLLVQRCKLIVLADCGADPDFRFDDVENLMRRARIDLNVNIRFLPPVPGMPSIVGTLDAVASPDGSACIAVALIEYGASGERGVLILVKPNLADGLPEDLYNYARDNPAFPQQTTADQFFNEGQWESYYALGSHLGRLLDAPMLNNIMGAALAAAPPVPAPDGSPINTRRPARLGGKTAAAATLGAGAMLTIVGALVSAFVQVRPPSQPAIDATTFRPLFAAYAEVSLKASVQSNAAVGRAAAEALVLAQSASPDLIDALETNPQAVDILVNTSSLCDPLRTSVAACSTFLRTFDCEMTRPAPTLLTSTYGYWARRDERSLPERSAMAQTYCKKNATLAASSSEEALAAVTVPALPVPGLPIPVPGPLHVPIQGRGEAPPMGALAVKMHPPVLIEPGAPAAAPAAGAEPIHCPATYGPKACQGVSVFVYLYGGEGRDRVRKLRTLIRGVGGSVPPFEDIVDTARRRGRDTPTPKIKPTVVYHDDAAKPCAQALAEVACQAPSGWEVDRIKSGFVVSPRTVEVWLPPATVAAGFDHP